MISASKTLVSEVCGKEHEVVGMGVVTSELCRPWWFSVLLSSVLLSGLRRSTDMPTLAVNTVHRPFRRGDGGGHIVYRITRMPCRQSIYEYTLQLAPGFLSQSKAMLQLKPLLPWGESIKNASLFDETLLEVARFWLNSPGGKTGLLPSPPSSESDFLCRTLFFVFCLKATELLIGYFL